MKFGLYLVLNEAAMPVPALARAAEERGFDSIWVPEHSHIPTTGNTPYPARGPVTPDRICEIRTAQGIVLARALAKEGSLLLLPGEGEVDFESVEIPDPGKLSDVVVGTHVLLIRR